MIFPILTNPAQSLSLRPFKVGHPSFLACTRRARGLPWKNHKHRLRTSIATRVGWDVGPAIFLQIRRISKTTHWQISKSHVQRPKSRSFGSLKLIKFYKQSLYVLCSHWFAFLESKFFKQIASVLSQLVSLRWNLRLRKSFSLVSWTLGPRISPTEP